MDKKRMELILKNQPEKILEVLNELEFSKIKKEFPLKQFEQQCYEKYVSMGGTEPDHKWFARTRKMIKENWLKTLNEIHQARKEENKKVKELAKKIKENPELKDKLLNKKESPN